MSKLDTLRDGVSFGQNVFKKKSQTPSTNLLYGSKNRATIPNTAFNRLTRFHKNNTSKCDSSDNLTEALQIPERPHTSIGTLPYSSSASTLSINSFVNINVITLPSITPLDNHFHNLNPVGIVALHWKHFKAFTTIGEKEASIFIFDKKCNVKAPARLGRINRLGLIDLLRYDIGHLTQLAHPRVLRTLHGLIENKDLIAFACEPIHTTLNGLFEEQALKKLEMKLGILQLIEGLSYLHNSAKILHGNLTPAAVFVTTQKQWKIANFSFAVNVFPCYPWTKRLPPCLQPDLDFLAPEYLDPNNQTVTTAADVFSLGVLICWVYAGGKRIIDVKNNLESYQIVVNQLDIALKLIDQELGANLKQSLTKILSKEVEQRPAVQMLALSLWFSRILQRFNEHLLDSIDLYPALLRSLIYMLNECESHNIYKLKPWFRLILNNAQEKALSQAVLDNMAIIYRRLNDEQVEDRCFDLLIFLLNGQDPHLKQKVLRIIPKIANYIPVSFIYQRLIPTLQTINGYFNNHIPRQIDLLVAIAYLSDRCDITTLHNLLTVASVCNALHPAVVHSKSRLVQRILTYDVSRLQDPLVIGHHLLNPLVLGLSLPELSSAHFDDVMSSTRILLDIVEQLRYESDEFKLKTETGKRLCNRRVSMSSNHLPRLLITAARPSLGGDGRKISFLSADGRLEDRSSRRESKDSRCSLESDASLRISGNGSDISDDSALHIGSIGGGSSSEQKIRQRSWLEGYMHSVSLEQSSQLYDHRNSVIERQIKRSVIDESCKTLSRSSNHSATAANSTTMASHSLSGYTSNTAERLSLTDMSNTLTTSNSLGTQKLSTTKAPTTFTNLGHNLACTLWKTFN